MKSKLEEKKYKLLKEHGYVSRDGHESHLGGHYSDGFDSGIQAYKEMLEGVGVEGIETYSAFLDCDGMLKNEYDFSDDRLITLVESEPVLAKLQQQAEKIELLTQQLRDLRWEKQDWYNGAALNDLHIEQGEQIAKLKADLLCAEISVQKINDINKQLESRLKDAESVIGFYADKSKFVRGSAEGMSAACCAITDEGGKLARQYMEKVK